MDIDFFLNILKIIQIFLLIYFIFYIKRINKYEVKKIFNFSKFRFIEFSGIKIHKNGVKEWYLNGKLHREDGPAVELANGAKFWYLNGKFHREDGPAIEYADGDKCWLLNDKLHRIDGPAIEYTNGTKEWWLNGEQVKRFDIFPITVLGFHRNSFKKNKEELIFEIISNN